MPAIHNGTIPKNHLATTLNDCSSQPFPHASNEATRAPPKQNAITGANHSPNPLYACMSKKEREKNGEEEDVLAREKKRDVDHG